MDTADRNAIEGLFSRLATVERRAPDRDPEAEALIADELRRLPSAPYYLAQTVLVQEHALTVAERRIGELESELERRPQGDAWGGLFGGGRDSGRRDVGQAEPRAPGPWDRENRGGGGFLAGAAQTALGVTSGILLGSAIAGMFGGGTANAAEAPPEPADGPPQDDSPADDAGGGDFGDGGDFDFGGDF
jgi:hypothetical protein